MDNKDQKLQRIIELAKIADALTATQAKQFVELLVNLTNKQKEELVTQFNSFADNVSQETHSKITEAIAFITEKANDNQTEVRQLTNKQQKAHDKQLAELKSLIKELQAIEINDGYTPEKGVDYFTESEITDIEKTILSKIPKAEKFELLGEDIVKSINSLEIVPSKMIDAKHIKNLPQTTQFIGGGSSSSGGGTVGPGTTNEIAYFNAPTTIASLSTATYPSLTELSYVKGVTSAIQTQLNSKQGTITLTTTGSSGAATLIGNTLNIPQYSGGGTPGGATTQFQYNNAGAFGGVANLTFNNSSGAITYAGSTNTTQLIFKANATQTSANPMFSFQDSAGTELGRINFKNDGAVAIGYLAGNAITTGENIFIGRLAGRLVTDGGQNVAIGRDSFPSNVSGTGNTAVGWETLRASTGNNNTAFGQYSLGTTTGANNIGLGYYAGRYTTGSNQLFIDTLDRTNSAGELASGLIYGVFNATNTSQSLQVNGKMSILAPASASTAFLFPASTTAYSPLRITSGSAPTTPVDGDIWHATNHIYTRLAGVTYQLDQQSGGGGITIGSTTITSGTSTRILFDDAGVVGEDSALTWNKTTNTLGSGLAILTKDAGNYTGNHLDLVDPITGIGMYINAGSGYGQIYTYTNHGYTFGTNNSFKMALHANGNLRISASNPQFTDTGQRLQVNGSIYSDNNSNSNTFLYDTGSVNVTRVDGGAQFLATDGRAGGETGGILGGTAGMQFEATSTGYMGFALEALGSFGSGNNLALKIEGSTLNAHFGNNTFATSDQSAQLAVTTSATSKIGFKVLAPTGQTADLQEWIVNGATLAKVDSSGIGTFSDLITSNGYLTVNTGGNMVVNPGGNFGVWGHAGVGLAKLFWNNTGVFVGGDLVLLRANNTFDANLTSSGFRVGDNNAATATLDVVGSLKVDSIVNDTGIAHGKYTPTLTNTTNVAASTARLCTYMRVGNTVTVSGQFDIDPTATATATLLGMSLPIASNFSTVYQAGGTANAMAIAGMSAGIEADPTNDRVSIKFISNDITNQTMAFTFSYEVI